ncbi:MAG TPA: hypothetical protein VFW07_23970 [Parafilimonas sp.]|nr:hypothetical protein [Parafilimonas sp.]
MLQIAVLYTIPGKGFERSGIIDSTAMFIGYWYPEMAVRDDIDGWDRIVYDAGTEFYHDYSDYDVEVEAPDNFMVWASVAPDNGSAVYPDFIQQRISTAQKSKAPVVIVGSEDYKNKLQIKSHTWHYTAKNFPDFAFALSDHFIWEARQYKNMHGWMKAWRNTLFIMQWIQSIWSSAGLSSLLKLFRL